MSVNGKQQRFFLILAILKQWAKPLGPVFFLDRGTLWVAEGM